MAKSTSPLPRALASGARRFDLWREARTTRRIPAKLWSLATDLGIRFGVSCTARALGVDYYALKKRIDAAGSMERNEAEPVPAFMEILTEPSVAPSECLVEFEITSGAKMRIEARGASTLDLAQLARLFLEQDS
jgi:hypothetical protein